MVGIFRQSKKQDHRYFSEVFVVQLATWLILRHPQNTFFHFNHSSGLKACPQYAGCAV
jgi:hypothetical protein